METGEIANWEETVDYIIYKDGSDIIAVNGNTGKEDKKSTDAYTVIQYCIDALTSGGHIHIKKGTYTIDTQLVLDDDITISGAGRLTVLSDGIADGTDVIAATSKDHVTLENIYVLGAGVATSGCGVKMITSSFFRVENCYFKDLGTAADDGGVCIEGCTDVIVRGCVMDTCINGYMSDISVATWCNRTRIEGNIIHDCADDGIHNTYVYGSCTIGNLCYDNGETDIDDWNAQNNVIANNICYSSLHGIEVGPSENTVISGNIIYDTTSSGISIATTVKYCTVVGNSIHNAIGFHGIVLNLAAEAVDIIIANNVVDTVASDGIRLEIGVNNKGILIVGNLVRNAVDDGIGTAGSDANSGFVIIKNNILCDNGSYGVQIEANVIDCIIEGNEFRNNTTGTILDNGTDTVIRNNIGHITENEGTTGAVADGGTFAHGLVTTPTGCVVTGTVTGDIIKVTGLGAANVTVSIKDEGGGAGTAQVLYFRTWVK